MVSAAQADGGFTVLLDGKPVKTPAKQSLLLPNEALATLIVKEWADQPDEIDPKTMRVMQIAVTAQDYVSANRADIEGLILRYIETDLLCYQVDQPLALARRQQKTWGDLLAWFKQEIGIDLKVKTDLIALSIPKADLDRAKVILSGMSDHLFAVFQLAVSLTGSFVLAYALIKNKASVDEIFKAAKLEELFMIEVHDLEKHGPDPVQGKEFDAFKRELEACDVFIRNL